MAPVVLEGTRLLQEKEQSREFCFRILRNKFTGLLSCRIARIACTPVVGMVSQQLWSFNSESQGYLQDAEGLEVHACSSSALHQFADFWTS